MPWSPGWPPRWWRVRDEFLGVAVAVEVGTSYGQEPHYQAQWPVPADAVIAHAEALVTDPVAKLIVRHAEPGDHWELIERVEGPSEGSQRSVARVTPLRSRLPHVG